MQLTARHYYLKEIHKRIIENGIEKSRNSKSVEQIMRERMEAKTKKVTESYNDLFYY